MNTSNNMTSLRCALYFGIYGPLFGAAMLFLVVVPISFGNWEQSSFTDYLITIPWTLAYSIWIVPVALILGIVPGSVTGLIYAWLRSRRTVAGLPVFARVAIMSLVGGAVCVLFGVCLGAAATEMLSKEILAMFVTPGIVAAAVCTWLADLRNRRQDVRALDKA
jgi:hypothetical protein